VDGVVVTTAGVLRGVEENGLWAFKGVPYARTGGGHDRWRTPEPPDPWHGVRDAAHFGPIAPQTPPRPGFSIPDDPSRAAENCLNLNVWTPGTDDRARPVMVWMHPGGFTSGSGSSLLYRGDRLAARGDVVVVTINYRLGALGFLAHPVLSDDPQRGCGNWGLYDQLEALRWVAANAGAFGGDPANVTVFGESAGAMGISALLGLPASAGLFRRAIVQSGPPATSSLGWATTRSERLAALAGVGGLERGDLERVTAEALVLATHELALEIPDDGGLPLAFMPVVDGGLLDRPPLAVITAGGGAAVPLMIGTTRDEAAPFTLGDLTNTKLDQSVVARRLARYVGVDAAPLIVEAYRQARSARGESVSGRDLWTAVATDFVFRLPSLAFASAQKEHQPSTFAYLFSWESPFMDGIFGSSHGLEIPFVFGTVHEPVIQGFTGYGHQAADISDQMQAAWLAFVRTGDPSCEAVGDWPTYDLPTRPTMVFGREGGVHHDPRGEERGAWERAGVIPAGGHHHE
jgi:para-nitrobenzyl esterase